MFLAIYGPDGVGKSTLIEKIKVNKNNLGYELITLYHFKPGFLPNRSQITQNSSHSVVGGRPYVKPNYPSHIVFIKLLYYFLDYLLLHIKTLLTSKNHLIIFDRYFLDLLIDSKRSRIGGQKTLIKFLYFFIPKPDIQIYLVGDASEIRQRKPELTVDEINELVQGYSFYGNIHGNVIDTSYLDADEVYDVIKSFL